MSGLLALLDDISAIAKLAAASVDDVIGQAAKAGSKAAGAVIDDAAVTPKYVTGFKPARELPIVWRIAKGSFKNKLIFLLPAGLLLANLAPWIITPLLMLGGAYLCFEGAEKVHHTLFDRKHAAEEVQDPTANTKEVEDERVAGAVRTDLILSAEIMTIALSEIPDSGLGMQAAILTVVAVGITVMVYGSVALIVKADDVGLYFAERGRIGLTRAIGRGIVAGMPAFLKGLTIVGTAAMLWVGGAIIVHGLKDLGIDVVYGAIHHAAIAVGGAFDQASGFVKWAVTATLDGLIGLLVGIMIVVGLKKVIMPLRGGTSNDPT
ncbi:MAG: DUF808 domain-containing protein [Pseudomonadota bacterium]